MKLFNNNIFQNKELLRELVKQVDLFNTVNGGTAMTSIDIIGSDESIVIKVSAPTVKAGAFNILLNYTKLTISSWVKEEEDEDRDRPLLIPMFVRTFDIPALVDLDKIEAVHEDSELTVVLPFKENTEGFQRMIEVKYK